MKVSELIKLLEKAMRRHGDVDVAISEYRTDHLRSVVFSDATDVIFTVARWNDNQDGWTECLSAQDNESNDKKKLIVIQ